MSYRAEKLYIHGWSRRLGGINIYNFTGTSFVSDPGYTCLLIRTRAARVSKVWGWVMSNQKGGLKSPGMEMKLEDDLDEHLY